MKKIAQKKTRAPQATKEELLQDAVGGALIVADGAIEVNAWILPIQASPE